MKYFNKLTNKYKINYKIIRIISLIYYNYTYNKILLLTLEFHLRVLIIIINISFNSSTF